MKYKLFRYCPMKNGRFIIAMIFVITMTVLALLPLQIIKMTNKQSTEVKGTQSIKSQTKHSPKPLTNQPAPPADPIQLQLDQMTLEEKVGQMFIGGSYKEDMLIGQLDLIKNKNFGGIILFGVNVTTTDVTASTVLQIKQVQNSSKYPLIVAIDEEGGAVSRLWSQLNEQTPQPNIKDTNQGYQVAFDRGSELKKLGINVNFSPVLDYSPKEESFMFDRIFRTSQEQIAKLSNSMIEGYKQAGIIAVPKHFPGHPNNDIDSHDSLPSSNITRDEFNSFAKQFEILIKSNPPEMLMTGHINFPNIDPKYPSTLSKIILTDILRSEYGYEGVLISDDMNMGAIKNSFQYEESIVLAVEAGNDILMLVTQPQFQVTAFNALVTNVKNGRITEERIDESVYRILEMKADL